MEDISYLYRAVRTKIEETVLAAGLKEVPELVAVSKFQTAEKLMALYREGQKLFGENYVQELIEKKQILEGLGVFDIEFHFIGKLQSNKVKSLLPHVSTLHSVDSLKLLREIEKQASALKKKLEIYLQINLDGEASKSGFLLSEFPALFKTSEWAELKNSEWVQIKGWMTIPNPDHDPSSAFQKMAEHSQKYREQVGTQLSMGMSDDYVQAIAHGATSLRIGSAIFGPRT